jgi:hypothetical protein
MEQVLFYPPFSLPLSLSPSLPLSYDLILVEGLPDWRQPIYYYRRVRKMGLIELTALLLVIGSVGQYIFGLAVYVEKKLVMVRRTCSYY